MVGAGGGVGGGLLCSARINVTVVLHAVEVSLSFQRSEEVEEMDGRDIWRYCHAEVIQVPPRELGVNETGACPGVLTSKREVTASGLATHGFTMNCRMLTASAHQLVVFQALPRGSE